MPSRIKRRPILDWHFPTQYHEDLLEVLESFFGQTRRLSWRLDATGYQIIIDPGSHQPTPDPQDISWQLYAEDSLDQRHQLADDVGSWLENLTEEQRLELFRADVAVPADQVRTILFGSGFDAVCLHPLDQAATAITITPTPE